MASELHVDAIKHSGGTSALTIDSSGNLTTSANFHSEGVVVQVKTAYYGANSGLYNSTSYQHISPYDVTITPKSLFSFCISLRSFLTQLLLNLLTLLLSK